MSRSPPRRRTVESWIASAEIDCPDHENEVGTF